MSNLLISGFEIKHYRSFGEVSQRLGPFQKVNVIIGQNNSGKSNILRFIRKVLPEILQRRAPKLDEGDRPTSGGEFPDFFDVLFPVDDASIDLFLGPKKVDEAAQLAARRFFQSLPGVTAQEPFAWIPLATTGDTKKRNGGLYLGSYNSGGADKEAAHVLYIRLRNSSGGDFSQTWLPDALNHYVERHARMPNCVFIPALRKIGTRMSAYSDEYGKAVVGDEGIIDELAKLSNPEWTRLEDKKRFEKIERFARKVLKNREIRIEIPHSKNTIHFEMDGRTLPIEQLGTGIHELIILAVRAVIIERSVVCIEEPELHFHPDLQRQFMQFIHDETDNQYFITTHSAHIMDAVPCAVFDVRLEGGKSVVNTPIDDNDRRAICHDLGYKPSDLLQSNSVIWVEGPSDRIYLNHWIQQIAPELEEGWHYSIMFYGGRLLSHVSVDDEEFREFIDLLPINRFPIIVIDSDRSAPHKKLRDAKIRIRDEFDRLSAPCWITKGREIENYISAEQRLAALRTIHPGAYKLAYEATPHNRALDYKTKTGKIVDRNFDKVGIAKLVCESDTDFGVLDLRAQVRQVVQYVRRANGLADS